MTGAQFQAWFAKHGGGFVDDLDEVLGGLRATLIQKNAAYGDSALSPLRVFSRADPEEQSRTRLDDKLSRIARGDGSGNEDAEADALGYLVLLRIAKLRRERAIQKPNDNIEKKE